MASLRTRGSNLISARRWSVIEAQKRFLQRHRVSVEELKDNYIRSKELSQATPGLLSIEIINNNNINNNNSNNNKLSFYNYNPNNNNKKILSNSNNNIG